MGWTEGRVSRGVSVIDTWLIIIVISILVGFGFSQSLAELPELLQRPQGPTPRIDPAFALRPRWEACQLGFTKQQINNMLTIEKIVLDHTQQ